MPIMRKLSRISILCWKTAPKPNEIQNAINGNPIPIPATCGSVRQNPNCAPLVATNALFGPGVQPATHAMPNKDKRVVGVIIINPVFLV